ncbi:DUF4145 domain-containing protein [Desulfobacterota bacterium AH_259_B03_O07]|nr:DUF4145 domain-containing protein [Desulfobacterota bacterium AH_259_B03_O07]
MWGKVFHLPESTKSATELFSVKSSTCARCEKVALWYKDIMLYPTFSSAPMPIEEMPEDVKSDFNEARNVVDASTRSAAALLRLAVQKLMPHLEQKGNNLNEDIGKLVKTGLPERVQESLDALRVIGNNAVHPVGLDIKDDRDTALKLFILVNTIIELTIGRKKLIDELYDKVPESSKEAIKKRDS